MQPGRCCRVEVLAMVRAHFCKIHGLGCWCTRCFGVLEVVRAHFDEIEGRALGASSWNSSWCLCCFSFFGREPRCLVVLKGNQKEN